MTEFVYKSISNVLVSEVFSTATSFPPMKDWNAATVSDTSTFAPCPPLSMSAIMSSICSMAMNIVSNKSWLLSFLPPRTRSSALSISCVKLATRSYPIVEDIPFSVCADRKISCTTSAPPDCSNLSNCVLIDWICSWDSSKNNPKYSFTSISFASLSLYSVPLFS